MQRTENQRLVTYTKTEELLFISYRITLKKKLKE